MVSELLLALLLTVCVTRVHWPNRSTYASIEEVREAMVLEGVMNLIISILQSRCPTDKEITMATLSALNNILFQCRTYSYFPEIFAVAKLCLVQNKQSFVREGGVAPLYRVLRTFIDDPKISELCVVTLRNLCSISNPYVSQPGMSRSLIISLTLLSGWSQNRLDQWRNHKTPVGSFYGPRELLSRTR